MIKNLIFDIGGVLVDFRPAGVLKELGVSEEHARVILQESIASPLWQEMDRGVLPEDEVIRAMREHIPEEMREEYDRFIYEGKPRLTIPFAYSEQWLKQFHDRGYGVYILSNYPVSYFEAHKDGFAFLNHTDGRVVSGYVKLLKPDPAIYRCLLEKYQLKAEECIFVDDLEVNAEGARSVGIHGIRFLSYEDANAKIEQLLKKEGTEAV